MYYDTESLRKQLLDEAYAGAFSGLGAMLLDEEEIRMSTTSVKKQIDNSGRDTGNFS